MKILKNNIRYLLKVHNMTVTELADRLNISQPSVSKWLQTSSDVNPTLQNLLALSDIFRVDVTKMLTVDLSDPSAQTGSDSIEEKIEGLILELERLRDRIKKSEGEKPPKPPKGGTMMCAFIPLPCY